METDFTWDCYQTLQLLLKVHNVLAQLDVIHPAETEEAWSDRQTPLYVAGIGQISSEYTTLGLAWDLPAWEGILTLPTALLQQKAKGILHWMPFEPLVTCLTGSNLCLGSYLSLWIISDAFLFPEHQRTFWNGQLYPGVSHCTSCSKSFH